MDPATLATVASVGSTALGAYGSYQDGRAQNEAAKFEAKQLKQQGEAAYAKGTKDAAEERRKASVIMANARAAGAASGGATDEGMLETTADIGAAGEYNSMAAMFDAESEQRGYNNKASARKYEGAQAKAAGKTKALSTILGGASSVASKWKKTPKET